MQIVWRGNEHTNKSSRRGYKPLFICNHITVGSLTSADSWFRSSGNSGSSGHFIVGKKGEIYQYVDIKENAWCNGSSSSNKKRTTAPFIVDFWSKNGYVNANWISVSIEHESAGEDLTEAQYQATLWLHRYIIDQMKLIWGYDMPIDREHIIGHKEIDNVNKMMCPMASFPYDRLIADLKGVQQAVSSGISESLQNIGASAVKSLHAKGYLNDVDGWSNKDMGEATPLWLAFLMLDRISGGTQAVQSTPENTTVVDIPDTSVVVTETAEPVAEEVDYADGDYLIIDVDENDTLNVRDEVSGNKVGALKNGDIVLQLDSKLGWYQIQFGNLIGWIHGGYVRRYHKNYRSMRRFNSEVHVFEAHPDNYQIDVSCGVMNKLEKLSDVKRDSKYEKDVDRDIVCLINGQFFDPAGSTEALGTYMDEGYYFKAPSKTFIDFIYYKDGHTEVKYIDGLSELAKLQKSAYFAIGTSYALMIDGEINLENVGAFDHAKYYNPRTLFGQKKDGTFVFVVVDGRNRNDSKGLTAQQSAELMKELGCYNAVNMDGGGSSEMYIEGVVQNEPSDGVERKVGSVLMAIEK